MRSFPDIRFREVLSLFTEARDGFEKDGPERTLDRVEVLRRRAAALGIRSAHVSWMAATMLEMLGRHEQAYREILDAVREDPFCPSYQDKFTSLAWELRNALAAPERAVDDPSTPRLYELLQATGESDVPCHLAMARHLAAAGRREEAARLLEAVLVVAPVSKDAWLERASLARDSGNEERATACQAEAERIGERGTPFDVSPAEAC